MKVIKKLAIALLVISMLGAFTGCSRDDTADDNAGNTTNDADNSNTGGSNDSVTPDNPVDTDNDFMDDNSEGGTIMDDAGNIIDDAGNVIEDTGDAIGNVLDDVTNGVEGGATANPNTNNQNAFSTR